MSGQTRTNPILKLFTYAIEPSWDNWYLGSHEVLNLLADLRSKAMYNEEPTR